MVGERLENGEYVRIDVSAGPDGMLRGHSPALGMDLCWDDGRLRFYDVVRTYGSRTITICGMLTKQPKEGRQAAEDRLAEERAARQAAEARMAEMEAELLRLRGEA